MFCCRRMNFTRQHGVFYSNNKSGFATFMRPFELRHRNSDLDYMISWKNPSSDRYLEAEIDEEPPSKAIWFLSERYPSVLGLADRPSSAAVGEGGVQEDAENDSEDEGGELVLNEEEAQPVVRKNKDSEGNDESGSDGGEDDEDAEDSADESEDKSVSDIFEIIPVEICMCRSSTCALFSTS